MEKEHEIEFTAPGYEAPEGTEDDKEFTELCHLKRKPDGSYCLYRVAGIPIAPIQSTEGSGKKKSTGERMVEQFKSSKTFDEPPPDKQEY